VDTTLDIVHRNELSGYNICENCDTEFKGGKYLTWLWSVEDREHLHLMMEKGQVSKNLCLEYSGRWTKFKMAVYFITIHDHQEH
jgi:hypothetical protein